MSHRTRFILIIAPLLFLLSIGLAVVAVPVRAGQVALQVSPTTGATATQIILPTPPPMPTSESGPEPTSPPVAPERPRTSTSTSTTNATPASNDRPDSCEKNNKSEQACMIGVDAVNGPYTFLPAGDQDWYRVDLGAQTGLATTITVRADGGLDLLTTLSRDDRTPLTTISSPAISATLQADISGPVLIRVENRSPGDPSGQSYNIEIRRVLPPPPPAPLPDRNGRFPAPAPDTLENDWNADTAATIGIGVMYDRNFTCPESWQGACGGGDHDYMRVPLKAGRTYVMATFDLGPGVDTELDLFWSDPEHPVSANDDIFPSGFASMITWKAPADGDAILRVAPRNGAKQPLVDDRNAGSYRVAVALADSDLARQLRERIAQSAGVPPAVFNGLTTATNPATNVPYSPPTATPRPTTAPISPTVDVTAIAPQSPAVMRDAPKGSAVVNAEQTILREVPGPNGNVIQTLPRGATVTLLGQAVGAWVRVLPDSGVVPGWMFGPDLVRQAAADRATAPQPTPATGSGQSTSAGDNLHHTPTSTPKPIVEAHVTEIDPLPATLEPSPAPRTTITISVTVAALADDGKSSAATKTATTRTQPLAGVRVQLVNAFGDVLTEAVTPNGGPVFLTQALTADQAVFIRLPAMGIQAQVELSQPSIFITIPEGARP